MQKARTEVTERRHVIQKMLVMFDNDSCEYANAELLTEINLFLPDRAQA